MKKIVLLSLFIIASIHVFACSCSPTSLTDNFKSSEFIATAKIINIQPDTTNQDYHNIEIEIIDLYKGIALKKLKILSTLNSSCSFYTEKNSTWLIFASTFNKILSFGFCSGSIQLDRKFDLAEYPNLDENYKQSNDLKLDVLKWLKQKNISLQNEFGVSLTRDINCYDNLKYYKGKNKDFAVLAFEINEDLTIGSVKLDRKFKNAKLSKEILRCSKGDIKISHKTLKTIPRKTKLYEIYYFYPEEDGNGSFISTYDL